VAYRLAGTYFGGCDCAGICPCPVDERPNTPAGECRGALVFALGEGNLNDTDLGGVNFALYNFFPSNITAGNWKVGIVIDESASDEQAQAIERILRGQEGGPFGDFAPLIGDFVGVERGRVTFSNGDRPSVSVADTTELTFEPFTGGDGTPTTVRNAMFGFAPEYRIGKASGQSRRFGLDFDAAYGESAQFEFSSEATDVHLRA